MQLGAELALASGWSGTGLLVLERGGHGYRQHSGELGGALPLVARPADRPLMRKSYIASSG